MSERTRIRRLSFMVLFAAVCFVVFTYGKISIPLPSGNAVAIHAANAAVVLSAWLIGPVPGGIAGAVGLAVADLLDPLYVLTVPKTFFLKFMIGYISGKTAEKRGLKETEDPKKIRKITLISAVCGLGFNVIAEPVAGYLYRRYILGTTAEAASILSSWLGGVTLLNAVICTIIAVLLYRLLYRQYRRITLN